MGNEKVQLYAEPSQELMAQIYMQDPLTRFYLGDGNHVGRYLAGEIEFEECLNIDSETKRDMRPITREMLDSYVVKTHMKLYNADNLEDAYRIRMERIKTVNKGMAEDYRNTLSKVVATGGRGELSHKQLKRMERFCRMVEL